MAIQQNAPGVLKFSFRHWDEEGTDLGPLNLDNIEHGPLEIVLEKPDGNQITIEDADVTVTDAPNGLAQWEADPNQLDVPGAWKAQAWAGEWPSRIVGFPVLGPNLK